jgi:hypothetical protein
MPGCRAGCLRDELDDADGDALRRLKEGGFDFSLAA